MNRPVTGIIGAMPEELSELLSLLQDPQTHRRAGFTLYRGRLLGHEVVLAQCGIGKVNAAALTQLLIVEGVGRIVFTGVAGAIDSSLRVGDIVISKDALQHDVDVTALGYRLGEVPGETLAWTADPHLVEIALEASKALTECRVVLGRIGSGDQFIASPERVRRLRETFELSCAEMEGAAVAQVCAKAELPFVIIRSISDTADHSAEMSFREFTPLAARRAKTLVRAMLESL